MNAAEFRALLDWFMCSDPWPVKGDSNHEIISGWINRESYQRGFNTWVNAYYNFNPQETPK